MRLKMKKRAFKKIIISAALFIGFGIPLTHAQGYQPIVGGKNNDWLFTPFEFATQSDAADTQATIQLLERASKLFERNGIALTVVVVPSKIRIHADQLPASHPLDAYTAGKYEDIAKALATAGVNVINLNKPFLASPHRQSDTPLFLRLDTHWSPSGAMLAAETIKAGIDATPTLKAALAATPEEKFSLAWAEKKTTTRARDMVRLMPQGSPSFPPEQILTFKASKVQASQAGLLGSGDNVGVTAIGSSYTNKNTGYPDALRYTLQRELLDISLPVDQGPWYGMDAYLRDESFKTRKPKLIIWEIPEREFRSPPNYKYRDSRYVIDNNEWLSRITSLLK
jgi:alginate O-acetyltransferase complex protein AlgJ